MLEQSQWTAVLFIAGMGLTAVTGQVQRQVLRHRYPSRRSKRANHLADTPANLHDDF
jgi:hypothetical protein